MLCYYFDGIAKKVLNAKMKLYILTPSTVEQTNKFKEYFIYELTQEPTLKFKDKFMHESHKPDLKKKFLETPH